jgi:predicted nucleotidyltransferase
LKQACDEAQVDTVVVGATAYRVWIDDDRHTEDVDVAIALDVDRISIVTNHLVGHGWIPDKRREERWLTRNGARIDILPVGEQARATGYLMWPKTKIRMSVVGFEHVFAEAVEVKLAPGLFMKVAPIPVLALTKIGSYMDDPDGRRKDLEDLGAMMRRYELVGERRFADEVFDAHCDFECAGAFLLGMDLGNLCTAREADIINRLIGLIRNNDTVQGVLSGSRYIGKESINESRKQVDAFAAGFDLGQKKTMARQE